MLFYTEGLRGQSVDVCFLCDFVSTLSQTHTETQAFSVCLPCLKHILKHKHLGCVFLCFPFVSA